MKTRSIAFALLAGYFAVPALAAPLRIADGDCTGLRSALDAPGDKDLLLAVRGNYRSCVFAVHGNAHVDAAGSAIGRIGIVAGAQLTLRNARIGADAVSSVPAPKKSVLSPAILPGGSASFIVNEGEFSLEASSISGVAYGVLRDADTPMINSPGALNLRNVTIAGNTAYNGAGLIGANGALSIVQSTIVGAVDGEQRVTPTLVGGTGTASIANSILSGVGVVACAHGSASLGGNMLRDASCGVLASDRLGDGGFSVLGEHGGLVLTLGLQAHSLAIGAGLPSLCEATDARGAARSTAGERYCDAGAYQYGGGNGHLSEGGINGSYFNADSDGHYVMIQRIDDRLALVTWSTFDQAGNAALIYGVGEVNGTRIHVATAARNSGGVMQAEGVPRGQHAEVWGSIDIALPRCSDGSFAYTSTASHFGSGQFALSRLVAIDGVECSE